AVRAGIRAAHMAWRSRGALHPGHVPRRRCRFRAEQMDRRPTAPEALSVRLSKRPHVRLRRLLRRRHLSAVDRRDEPDLALGGHGRLAPADPGGGAKRAVPALTLVERRARRPQRGRRLLADLPLVDRPATAAAAVGGAGGVIAPGSPSIG